MSCQIKSQLIESQMIWLILSLFFNASFPPNPDSLQKKNLVLSYRNTVLTLRCRSAIVSPLCFVFQKVENSNHTLRSKSVLISHGTSMEIHAPGRLHTDPDTSSKKTQGLTLFQNFWALCLPQYLIPKRGLSLSSFFLPKSWQWNLMKAKCVVFGIY